MKNDYFSGKDEMKPFMVKKTNSSTSLQDDEEPFEKDFLNEQKGHDQAGTMHIMKNDRRHIYEMTHRKNRRVRYLAKPLVVSSLSAIVIGVLLGFIVLRMSIGGQEVQQGSASSSPSEVIADDSNEDKGNSDLQATSVELKQLQAYVLQVGVFTEEENTGDAVDLLEKNGFAAIVWENAEQYYVFTNIFSTEEQAKNSVDQLEKKEIENYAKLWTVDKQTIDATDEEVAFLQDFVETWEETVEKHTNNEVDSINSWEKLVDEMPESEENAQDLIDYLDENIQQAEEAIDIEQMLLETWHLYSQIAGA